jgi:hypothetical protein
VLLFRLLGCLIATAAQTFELDLVGWKSDCGGQSCREDDEKAVLSGHRCAGSVRSSAVKARPPKCAG